MITLPSHVVSQFGQIYSFANSPEYLARELRRLPSVQRLATDYPIEALLETIHDADSNPTPALAEVATAYAAAVAMTLRHDAHAQVKELSVSRLVWVPAILNRWIESRVSLTATTAVNASCPGYS